MPTMNEFVFRPKFIMSPASLRAFVTSTECWKQSPNCLVLADFCLGEPLADAATIPEYRQTTYNR